MIKTYIYPIAAPKRLTHAKDLWFKETTTGDGSLVRDIFLVVLGKDGEYALVDLSTGYEWQSYKTRKELEEFIVSSELKKFRGEVKLVSES